MKTKNKHCSFCGEEFWPKNSSWPRTCYCCKNISYLNPIPVVIGIIPVHINTGVRFLIEKRGIAPQKGGWALPSGYIDFAETWPHAIVREVFEEVGLKTDEKNWQLFDVVNGANHNLLIFAVHSKIISFRDIDFKPNNEVSGIDFISSQMEKELCFPTHNEMLAKHCESGRY
jgi:8-oxo-dGTP pyrophosphatase MutT (NUDIX family)